ncbi:MAG: ABC transporter permease subunit [Planctomycetes bacterium]|nr:ABC transporter permease subunit [Planctomycetota bacterium]
MSARVEALYKSRPRSRFVQLTLWSFGLFTLLTWLSGVIQPASFLTARRLENLERFLTVDIVPAPLREGGFDLGALITWTQGVLLDHGLDALLATLAISVLAIVLAMLLSWLFAPLAAATLSTRRPFDATPGQDLFGWRALRLVTRAVMILLRSIPEYVLAFLLLAILGPNHAWPAVLALALHNSGILGRLGAETIENLDPQPLRTLTAIGAPRRSLLVSAVFPLALGRYLLYFFYRFETCVREATVLGMLGVVSLGYYIQQARGKMYYDEMLLLILLGAGIVIASDILSAVARRYLRTAS